MAKEVRLVKDNMRENGYVGFSWTVFFFGGFVPLFRKDFKMALILIVGTMIVVALTGMGGGIINLIMCFWYNKYYTENLIKIGFTPVTDEDKRLLREYKIYL
ncbi:MAG: HrgC protein [Leptotrichiaceae bacterium]|nr:HrgC protein [Leptotrichiaceae bacterium]